MWQCVKCSERVEDDFEVCWNCGTSREGIEDPAFQRAEQVGAEELASATPQPVVTPKDQSTAIQEKPARKPADNGNRLLCPRCDRYLDFIGTKSFHEGFQWGVLGDWAELFVNKEELDLYACRRCGHVEFFISGVGENLRPAKSRD